MTSPPELTKESLRLLTDALKESRLLYFGWALAFRMENEQKSLEDTSKISIEGSYRIQEMLAPFVDLEKARSGDEEGRARVVFLRSDAASNILFALHPSAGKYCKLIGDLAEMGDGPGFGGEDEAGGVSVGLLEPVALGQVGGTALLPEASLSRGQASLGEWAAFYGQHAVDEAASLSEEPLEGAAAAFQAGLLASLRASAPSLSPPLVIDVLGFDNAVLALIAAYSHMLAMRHHHLEKRGTLLDPSAALGSDAPPEAAAEGPAPREEEQPKATAKSLDSIKSSADISSKQMYAFTTLPKPAAVLRMDAFTSETMGSLWYHPYEAIVARQFLLPFLPKYTARPELSEVQRLERIANMEAPAQIVTETLAEFLAHEHRHKVGEITRWHNFENKDMPEGLQRYKLVGNEHLIGNAPQTSPAEAKAKIDAMAAAEMPALRAALSRTVSVMNAANFMQHSPLVELCGLCVAMIAKGRSLATMKELFAAVCLYAPVSQPC